MEQETTARTIIDLWPSRVALAGDINTPDDPVTVAKINKWAQRCAIPSRYHGRILRAGLRRGFDLSAEAIVRAHDLSPHQEDAA